MNSILFEKDERCCATSVILCELTAVIVVRELNKVQGQHGHNLLFFLCNLPFSVI